MPLLSLRATRRPAQLSALMSLAPIGAASSCSPAAPEPSLRTAPPVCRTGAPHWCLAGLVPAALAALRWAAAWVLAPAVFLASGRTESEALDRIGVRPPARYVAP